MTQPKVYYNENDPYAAQWLRNLQEAGLIPKGVVDERDIQNVQPEDLSEFTQLHFFAGIGGWPYALQLTNWGTRPVWTGSCPCQPFSGAGKRKGNTDERHLWPAWFNLIRQRQPPTIFGEQVASKDALKWFDLVSSDLESENYTVGAADLCAASVKAPHIRQRLFFMAHANGRNSSVGELQRSGEYRQFSEDSSATFRMAHAKSSTGGLSIQSRGSQQKGSQSCGSSKIGQLGDPNWQGLEGWDKHTREHSDSFPIREDGQPNSVANTDDSEWRQKRIGRENGRDRENYGRQEAHSKLGTCGEVYPWNNPEWLPCTDGKARPTQPGLFPLVDGVSFRLADGRTRQKVSRTKTLRGIGNAIVPQVAAAFIQTYMDIERN
jgi:DNA (cytosine-5)-methyltransferase 1